MEYFKIPKNIATIKELLVKYISRIIMEGNGLSKNVQDYLLYGKNVDFVFTKKDKDQKGDRLFSNYTHQVGTGNNHHLIKMLMKERWWTSKIKSGTNEEV